MEVVKDILFSTPLLKVLDALLQHSHIELSDTEIIKKITGAKRAAIHHALKRLGNLKITHRVHKGRRCYNQVNLENAWLLPLKIAINILDISPLIERIKRFSIKVILFGSRSNGTNNYDSDYDLLIITQNKDLVLSEIYKKDKREKIQAVIKTADEMLSLQKDDPLFFKEIHKGVVLWEKQKWNFSNAWRREK